MFYDFEIHVSYLTPILLKFTRLTPVYTFLNVIFDIMIIKFVTNSIITIFYVELDLFLNYLVVVHLSIISLNKQARSILQLRRLQSAYYA